MNGVFASVIGKLVVISMDEILVDSKTVEEHLLHLRAVPSLLRKNKLHAKLSTCEFLRDEFMFLAYMVSADGIKPNPSKLAAVQEP